MNHTRVLAWGDYCVYTGFANVMSNIFRRLQDNIDLDVIGINHDGRPDYDHARFPGRVWPARSYSRQGQMTDVYGVTKLFKQIEESSYDTLFILGDPFVVDKVMGNIIQLRAEKPQNEQFKIIYYYPLDTSPYASWIRESAVLADFPVTYTKWSGLSSINACPELLGKLQVIPHGIDFHDFNYIPRVDNRVKAMRNRITNDSPDVFLLVNINRNTPRKDIHRSLMVLSELKTLGERVMLYLHCSPKDIGGDFRLIAQWLGLQEFVDYIYPHDLDPINGYSVEDLNLIYNAADAVITTSLGEGWGYSITEAMATKTPVIAPSHTSIRELIADGRGFSVESGNTSSLWRVIENDNMVLRPLTSVEDMASKVQWLIMRPGDGERTAEKAYRWVHELDWDRIVEKQWKPLLLKDRYGNNTLN